MDNKNAFVFDDPSHSTTLDSTRCVGRWAKDVPLPSEHTRDNVQAEDPLLPARGGASPRGAVHRGRTWYGVISHRSFAHSNAHVNTFVYNKQP